MFKLHKLFSKKKKRKPNDETVENKSNESFRGWFIYQYITQLWLPYAYDLRRTLWLFVIYHTLIFKNIFSSLTFRQIDYKCSFILIIILH